KNIKNIFFLLLYYWRKKVDSASFSQENEIVHLLKLNITLTTRKSDEVEKVKKSPFGYHSPESNNKLFEFCCEISKSMFDRIVDICSNTSESTVGNIILTLICALYKILISLDCTNILCNIPKFISDQKLTYRLIGVAPNGVITYASKLYPGSTSDKKNCRPLWSINYITTRLPNFRLHVSRNFLKHLPFSYQLISLQFNPSKVLKTISIARARIHVERVIKNLIINPIITNFVKIEICDYSEDPLAESNET
ncbi:THAP-type domain-containing protein, partial [Aphis craccivora]